MGDSEAGLRIVSAIGILVMLLLAWAMGKNRSVRNYRVLLGGLGLQLVLALLVMRTNEGNLIFSLLGEMLSLIHI